MAVAAVALLAACGGEPAVSTTPAPTPAASSLPSSLPSSPLGASSPVDAVRALLATGGPTLCRPQAGQRWSPEAGCPVTPRLAARLQSDPASASGGGADPICRCQNSVPATLEGGGPSGTAIVRATFQLNPPLVITFIAVQQAQRSGWLVDDQTCGDPSTSIYLTPVRPCR